MNHFFFDICFEINERLIYKKKIKNFKQKLKEKLKE